MTGKKIDVKVSKILAGQEAERTNSVLVSLAKAVEDGLSSREAVKTLTGVDPEDAKPTGPSKKEAAAPKKTGGLEATKEKKALGSTGNLAGTKAKQVHLKRISALMYRKSPSDGFD